MIPDIVLPETEIPERAVQLYIGDEPLLICGPEDKGHGRILEDILNDRGLKFDKFNAGDEKAPFMVPHVSGPGYRVVGMGKCQYTGKFYSLFGNSVDYIHYIKGIDRKHAEDIQAERPELILEVAEE